MGEGQYGAGIRQSNPSRVSARADPQLAIVPKEDRRVDDTEDDKAWRSRGRADR